MRSVLVTGASGYVGAALVSALNRHGYTAIGPASQEYRLQGDMPPEYIDAAEVVIHTAWDRSPRNRRDYFEVNVAGTEKLLARCLEVGVRSHIFVSSLAAHSNARSWYGQSKFALEKVFAESGAMVIRPGTIWGGDNRGIVGALEKVVHRVPVIPLPGAMSVQLGTIHIEDFTRCLESLIASPVEARGPIVASAQKTVTLKELIDELARRIGRRRLVVPIPMVAAFRGMQVLEFLGLRLGVTSDSLASLLSPTPQVPNNGMFLDRFPIRNFGESNE